MVEASISELDGATGDSGPGELVRLTARAEAKGSSQVFRIVTIDRSGRVRVRRSDAVDEPSEARLRPGDVLQDANPPDSGQPVWLPAPPLESNVVPATLESGRVVKESFEAGGTWVEVTEPVVGVAAESVGAFGGPGVGANEPGTSGIAGPGRGPDAGLPGTAERPEPPLLPGRPLLSSFVPGDLIGILPFDGDPASLRASVASFFPRFLQIYGLFCLFLVALVAIRRET
jgi:hypothetical protein